jgi:YihY family inner membrane protein
MAAVIPFGIALLAILGFTVGNLNPQAQAQMIDQIRHAFPSAISSQDILQPAITRLNQSAGILTILAVLTALFGGARLFMAIERSFDIVYRTDPRRVVPQYVMALLMMLVFIALIPIMVLASSLPAVILSLFQSSILNQIPGVAQILNNGLVLSLASMVGGVLVGWILFQAIYMVVPNQRISIKNSWRGALTSAVLLELFLILFPFYVTHFMKSYTGVVGFGVIFLLFFYYFAVILLFGAEVNAYFAEHVAPLPGTLATILRQAVGNPTEPAEPEKLLQAAGATASQTDTDTNASRLTQDASSQTQEKQADVSNSARQTVQEMTPKEQEEKQADKSSSAPQTVPQKASETQENKPSLFSRRKKRARKAAKPAKTRRTGELIEAVAGTILAFAATLIRQRRKAEH